jgi:hypothetical protein
MTGVGLICCIFMAGWLNPLSIMTGFAWINPLSIMTDFAWFNR